MPGPVNAAGTRVRLSHLHVRSNRSIKALQILELLHLISGDLIGRLTVTTVETPATHPIGWNPTGARPHLRHLQRLRPALRTEFHRSSTWRQVKRRQIL